MTPDDPNAQALGSFRVPVALLNIDPDDPPLVGVCFNSSYLPYIVGALKQLLLQATWNTSDPDELNIQQGRIFNLIGQFAEECPMFAPGLIMAWGSPGDPPIGWLLCDGSAVSRTVYADLFASIGTTFGVGDGSTTFNVPATPSRAPIGAGIGSGLSARALGAIGGSETIILSSPEMPSHNHGLNTFDGLSVAPGELPVKIPTLIPTDATANTGGGGSHDNMQPWIAFNWVIKT